ARTIKKRQRPLLDAETRRRGERPREVSTATSRGSFVKTEPGSLRNGPPQVPFSAPPRLCVRRWLLLLVAVAVQLIRRVAAGHYAPLTATLDARWRADT